jgi:hypothetical protein
MKSTLIATSILAAATLLVSCGDHGVDSHTAAVEDHAAHADSATLDDGLGGLALDNGRKWEMDDHTRTVFARMAGSFLNSAPQAMDEEGLKKAGADLQVDINALIQGCTMTGAAHDQLHVYLTGYMPAVAALSDSGQIEDAETVTNYLERYDEYFE